MILRELEREVQDLGSGGYWAAWLQAARTAQRFVFSEAASMAAEDLAEAKPNKKRAIAAAAGKVFVPFSTTWAEFSFQGTRAAFLWVSAAGEHQRGHLTLIWRMGGLGGWAPAVDWIVDLAREGDPSFERSAHCETSFAHFAEAFGPEASLAIAALHETADSAPRAFLALMALLASKSMTASVEADLTKLNRARAKRGRWPLMAYTEIRLNIDAERAVRSSRATATGNMPLHPVRAHLRLLPSGQVVIVSAHMRGNAENGIRFHHYTVGRDEDFVGGRYGAA